MKLKDAIVITKGACLTTGGMAAALAGGLPETDLTTIGGISIKLICLICGVYGVGCNILYGYLSQGVANYMNNRANIDLVKPS